MTGIKKLVATGLVVGMTGCMGFTAQAAEMPKVEVIATGDLTYEMLTTRMETNTIYIEYSIGINTNENGDGRILNTDSEYNYISYRGVDGCEEGDIVITYCIYNPETNYEDDIICRADYIIE